MKYYYVIWKTVYGSVTKKISCRDTEPPEEYVHCEQYLERDNAEARADYVRNVLKIEPEVKYP